MVRRSMLLKALKVALITIAALGSLSVYFIATPWYESASRQDIFQMLAILTALAGMLALGTTLLILRGEKLKQSDLIARRMLAENQVRLAGLVLQSQHEAAEFEQILDRLVAILDLDGAVLWVVGPDEALRPTASTATYRHFLDDPAFVIPVQPGLESMAEVDPSERLLNLPESIRAVLEVVGVGRENATLHPLTSESWGLVGMLMLLGHAGRRSEDEDRVLLKQVGSLLGHAFSSEQHSQFVMQERKIIEALVSASRLPRARQKMVLENTGRMAKASLAELWIRSRKHDLHKIVDWHSANLPDQAQVDELAEKIIKAESGSGEAALHVFDTEAESIYAEQAQAVGVYAALRVPVLSEAGILGHMLFMWVSPGSAKDVLIASLDRIARILGNALLQERTVSRARLRARKYRALVEGALVGVCQLDQEGRVVWANRSLQEWLGYSKQEIIGRTIFSFSADSGPLSTIRQGIESQAPIRDLEVRFIAKDGSMKTGLIAINYHVRRQRFDYARCFIHDISSLKQVAENLSVSKLDLEKRVDERTRELKRINLELLTEIDLRVKAEKEGRDREAHFKALIDHTPDILLVLNMEGELIFISPSFSRELGYSAQELEGKNFFELLHPDDLLPAMDWFQKLVSVPDHPHKMELRTAHADGGWRYLDAIGKNYLGDASIAGIVMNLWDVTTRKVDEEALRESEERFRLLVENAETYAFYVLDPEGRIVSWNEGAARIKGYSSAEALGKHYALFFTEEDVSAGAPARQLQIAREQGSFRAEGLRVRKDGSTFWADVTITPLYTEDELRGYAKITRDVTLRRVREEQLRRQKELLQEAQRTANIGSWEWDATNNSYTLSDQLYRILGLSDELEFPTYELFLQAIPEEDRARVESGIAEAVAKRESFSFQHQILHGEGEVRIVETRGVPELDSRGALLRMFGTVQDITEQKTAEEQVRIQHELYLSLLKAQSELGEGILLADAAGKAIYVNEALHRLLGVEISSFQTLTSLFDHLKEGGDREAWAEMQSAMQNPTDTSSGEITVERDAGVRMDLEYAITAIDSNHNQRLLLVLREITARRQAEEQLRLSREKLRLFSNQLETAREEESARISREIHDELGQRLTGIKMDLAWLSIQIAGNSSAEPTELVEKVSQMSSLVDDTVHEIRRIATELRPGILDDLGLVAALDWQLTDFERRTGINCRLASAIEVPELTEARTNALFRIFQEALTNVARHSQATKVEVKFGLENDHVVLEVIDNGKGIKSAELVEQRSLGILGMFERARLVGGETTIKRAGRKGTRVRVKIPISPGAEGEGAS